MQRFYHYNKSSGRLKQHVSDGLFFMLVYAHKSQANLPMINTSKHIKP